MNESQRNAKKKYRAKGVRLTVDFYPSEADLIEQIEKQPKKQTYIKDLIRADIQHRAEWVQTSALCNPYCSACKKYNESKTAFCPNCGKEMNK